MFERLYPARHRRIFTARLHWTREAVGAFLAGAVGGGLLVAAYTLAAAITG